MSTFVQNPVLDDPCSVPRLNQRAGHVLSRLAGSIHTLQVLRMLRHHQLQVAASLILTDLPVSSRPIAAKSFRVQRQDRLPFEPLAIESGTVEFVP